MLFLLLPGVMAAYDPTLNSDNLSGYWAGDSAVGYYDALGLLNGTVNAATNVSDGIISRTYNYSTAQNITIPDDEGLDGISSTAGMTWSFWYNCTDCVANARGFMSKGVTTGAGFNFGTNAGKIYGFIKNTAGSYCELTAVGSAPTTNVWHHLVFVRRGTVLEMWQDGVNTANKTGCPTGDLNNTYLLTLGFCGAGIGGINGKIDEVGIWNVSLPNSNITALYNSGAGFAYPFGSITMVYGVGDLVFSNESDATPSLTSFDEDSDFYSFVNWTLSNGSVQESGECNITYSPGIVEYEGLFEEDTNYSICTSGCNSTSFLFNMTGAATTGATKDDFHFLACRHASSSSFTANISCPGASYQRTILNTEYPLCSQGMGVVHVNTTACIGQSAINLTLTTTATNAQRRVISDPDLDRYFSTQVDTTTYNDTLELWVGDSLHEYYTHGSYTINASCWDSANASFNVNVSENITVVNVLPVIYFGSVDLVDSIVNLSDLVQLEYNVEAWDWSDAFSVVDDDERNYSVAIRNSSGSVLKSWTGSLASAVSGLTTAAEFFRWFENPYNLSVWVNDSYGNYTNASIRFVVNDTVSPVITWVHPANASSFDKAAGGQIEFFSQCSDPALYRYNLTVYNISTSIYSYQEVNVLGTIWNNQTFIDVADFATLNNATNYSHSVMTLCADSHTGEALAESWLPEKDFVEDLSFRDQGISLFIKEKENIKTFEPVYKEDRVSFDIQLKTPSKTLTIDLYGTDITPVANQLGYACHAVLSNPITKEPAYWFDADMPGLESCKLVCLGSDHCQALVTLKEESKELLVESVGEVNIYNETRYFSVYDSSVLTVNWTGLVCGERYPDNVHNLTFEGESITNCTLHINDRLYEGWTSDCGNISIETDIGRQYLELSFLDSFNASTVDACTIWTDKLDQDVGDFMWLIILGVVWGFLVFMSFSSAPALSIVGGLVGIFVSYELMAYSMVLAGIFLLFNVVIIFKR